MPEFIKELPNDPFTGKSFCYVVGEIELPIDRDDENSYTGRYKHKKIVKHSKSVSFIKRLGWLVYSLSKDEDDDHGMPMHFMKYDDGDIPFRCVRGK